jgi:hypothetical protein
MTTEFKKKHFNNPKIKLQPPDHKPILKINIICKVIEQEPGRILEFVVGSHK